MLGVSQGAVEDLRYLLGRGYGRISAVKFVGDRHTLNKEQRILLYRGVYSPEAAMGHLKKIIAPEEVKGRRLAVDGYNVLITINGVLKKNPVFLCDDGLVRDASETHSSASREDLGEPLRLSADAIRDLGPSNSHFVFDRLISRSGELSKRVAQELRGSGVAGGASTATSADFEVLKRGDIISSSDSVVIDRAPKIFDLAAYVMAVRLGFTPQKI